MTSPFGEYKAKQDLHYNPEHSLHVSNNIEDYENKNNFSQMEKKKDVSKNFSTCSSQNKEIQCVENDLSSSAKLDKEDGQEEEIWKNIPSDFGVLNYYEVSNYGKIRNKNFETQLHCDIYGRYSFQTPKGSNKKVMVQKIMASVWIPNPQNYKFVDFIDGNPLNRKISNLKWVRHKSSVRSNALPPDHQFRKPRPCIKDPELPLGVVYIEETKAYRANIRINGKYIQKYFLIKNTDKFRAKEQAIEWRKEKEKEKEKEQGKNQLPTSSEKSKKAQNKLVSKIESSDNQLTHLDNLHLLNDNLEAEQTSGSLIPSLNSILEFENKNAKKIHLVNDSSEFGNNSASTSVIEEKEIWKDFPTELGFFDYYEVSSQGQVRNKNMKTILKGSRDGSLLSLQSKTGTIKIERKYLVAYVFLPNPSNYKFVTYIDENKFNCKKSNLKWVKEKFQRRNNLTVPDDYVHVKQKRGPKDPTLPLGVSYYQRIQAYRASIFIDGKGSSKSFYIGNQDPEYAKNEAINWRKEKELEKTEKVLSTKKVCSPLTEKKTKNSKNRKDPLGHDLPPNFVYFHFLSARGGREGYQINFTMTKWGRTSFYVTLTQNLGQAFSKAMLFYKTNIHHYREIKANNLGIRIRSPTNQQLDLLQRWKRWKGTVGQKSIEINFEQWKLLVLSGCFYCGYIPTKFQTNGIDRIDSNILSYRIDNIISSCLSCNYMKSVLPKMLFLGHLSLILMNHGFTITSPTSKFTEQELKEMSLAANPMLLRRFKKITWKIADYQDKRKIFLRYIQFANHARHNFNLTFGEYSDFIKRNCYYCNAHPSQVTISLDRIDSFVCYIVANIVASCFNCNGLKNTSSFEELKNHAMKILKYQGFVLTQKII